jgi:hypothetical protein
MLLAWLRATRAAIRIIRLPINPSSSNIVYSSIFALF